MNSTFKMLTITLAGSCIIAAFVIPAVLASRAAPIPAKSVFSAASTVTSTPVVEGDVTVNSKTVEDTTDIYAVNLQIPVISGMLDEHYQDQLNDIIERHAMEDLALMKAGAAEDAAYAKEAGYTFHPYELDIRYSLKAAGGTTDGSKLSLTVQTYTYTGGAHGGARVDTYNVNNEQEASLLTLEQLLGDDYMKQVDTAVREAIAADPDSYFTDEVGGFKGISESQPFYVAGGQLFIVFQEYEIAPYAAGIVEIPVTLAEQAERAPEHR